MSDQAIAICKTAFPRLNWHDKSPLAINMVLRGVHPDLCWYVEARFLRRDSIENAIVSIKTPLRDAIIITSPEHYGVGLLEAIEAVRRQWGLCADLMRGYPEN